jgi:two-component system chemotaxis sensor kinase CheA
MSSDPLVQAFFEEATELLADFEAGLLELEDRPNDAELLNRIFRSAHTLKGNSSMLGFEEVAHFTHVLEDLLDQLRKGLKQATPRLVDTLLSSKDVVRGMLARAEADAGGPAADEVAERERVLEALQACLRGEEIAEAAPRAEHAAAPAPAPAGGRVLYEIRFRPPADLFRRGMDPQQVIADLERLGELVQVRMATDGLPPIAEMDPELSYLAWEIWLLSDRPSADIDACFEFIGDPAAVQIVALPMGGDAPATVSGGAEHGDAATAHAPAHAEGEGRRAPAAAAAEAASIRVPVEKVDRLINLVGELVITQSMIAQAVSNFSAENLEALQEAVGQMDRHARELHERIMAVRMIPIKTLFGRFPRLVRDLTAAIGKQAVLETYGEETELDKTVIEKIGDPLTHLVRNAVDHGLETPEERARAGKPERGCVRLEAYQEGGSIYIEVADDGKGLDRDRIVAKAVQNGLIGAEQVLTDEEAFGLVFRPGLSTAEKITEVSGRGVGMDVVKRNVEALGGSITIQSDRGRGTTFRIKLPLTLAIMDGQTVCVGDQVYLLPLTAIVESIRPTRAALASVLGRGETVTVRGQVVPVIRLHELFGVRPRTRELTEALVVIVEHEGRLAAIGVDDLLGQQQVVIKSLEQNFEKVEGVAGATILGDGRVALILDVPGLVALARAERGTGRVEPVAAAA